MLNARGIARKALGGEITDVNSECVKSSEYPDVTLERTGTVIALTANSVDGKVRRYVKRIFAPGVGYSDPTEADFATIKTKAAELQRIADAAKPVIAERAAKREAEQQALDALQKRLPAGRHWVRQGGGSTYDVTLRGLSEAQVIVVSDLVRSWEA